MFERKNYALQVALKKYHEENHTLPERVWCITYKLLLLFVVSYSTRIETGGGGGGGAILLFFFFFLSFLHLGRVVLDLIGPDLG